MHLRRNIHKKVMVKVLTFTIFYSIIKNVVEKETLNPFLTSYIIFLQWKGGPKCLILEIKSYILCTVQEQ